MLRLTLYECVVKICIQGWFLIRNWIFGRIICRTMKNKDVNAIEPRKTKGAQKKTRFTVANRVVALLACEFTDLNRNINAVACTYVPCILVGTTQAFKEYGQIREKIQLIVKSTADQEECAGSSYRRHLVR